MFIKKRIPHKLIAGFAALFISTTIAATGLAGATPMHKPSKQECKAAGYKNYGQCVKDWAHHKPHPGHGYGGNNSIATNINLALNHSNNNIIKIIINIFR